MICRSKNVYIGDRLISVESIYWAGVSRGDVLVVADISGNEMCLHNLRNDAAHWFRRPSDMTTTMRWKRV